MFDISFGELLLVFVLGLIVLGPQRLPVAVKTVAGWIRALRSLASSVQSELAHELKLQELQDSLKKVEKASMDNLTPELKASMDELREAAESMKRAYSSPLDPEKASDEDYTIHNPVKTEQQPEEAHQVTAPREDNLSSVTSLDENVTSPTGGTSSAFKQSAQDVVPPETTNRFESVPSSSEKH